MLALPGPPSNAMINLVRTARVSELHLETHRYDESLLGWPVFLLPKQDALCAAYAAQRRRQRTRQSEEPVYQACKERSLDRIHGLR